MPRLAELQAQFAAALLDPATGEINTCINANGIAANRRIAVYRNNTRISQMEALAGIYPAVQQLVGEEFFEYMAEEYGARYPSTSGDLREYGGGLAPFLSSYEPVAELHYLPDIARLEWAWHECFHAADAHPLDAETLNAMAGETGEHPRLLLIPASRLLSSSYPVATIWEYALDPDLQRQKLNLDKLGEARLLIARAGGSINVMELTPAQFFWLDHINNGEMLTAVFEQTMEHYPEFDFAKSLATFVNLGVLTIQEK